MSEIVVRVWACGGVESPIIIDRTEVSLPRNVFLA